MLDDIDVLAERPAQLVRFDVSSFRSLGAARLEDEVVWTREWVCVGTRHEVPESGDLLPFTVGDHAIHLQRQDDGALAGRFNKAQHGGCRVVPVQCRQGTKTPCSFTSCGHSRDRPAIRGSDADGLAPAMHQYLGLRPERLLGVRTAAVGPLLFASLDPHGAAIAGIADWLRAALPTLERDERPLQGSEWLEFDCNWKLAGRHLIDADQVSGATGPCGLLAWTTVGAKVAQALWLFPNLLLLALGGSVCAVVLQPVALTRTLCRVSVLGEQRDDVGPWMELLRRRGERGASAQRAMDHRARDRAGEPVIDRDDAVGKWLQNIVMSRLHAAPASMNS